MRFMKAFLNILKTLVKKYRFGAMTINDLQEVAEKVSKKNLNYFFKEWVYGVVLPCYEVVKANALKVKDKYRINIILRNKGSGAMPVEVAIKSKGKVVIERVWMNTEAEESLELFLPFKPLSVEIDPEK